MLIAPARATVPAKDVVSALRDRINDLEGAPHRFGRTIAVSDAIDLHLPGGGLPLGCMHEIKGNPANAIAFAGLLSSRIPRQGATFYIEPQKSFYPLGLLPYGVNLQSWIHIRARRPKDLVWAALEALRCPQVTAVLAVMEAADLTFCRRLQLAAESYGVTGFILGSTASAITRWRVKSQRNSFWSVDLLYCRNGRPASWQVQWRNGSLETLQPRPAQRQQTTAPVRDAAARSIAG
jgi:protein ImuA